MSYDELARRVVAQAFYDELEKMAAAKLPGVGSKIWTAPKGAAFGPKWEYVRPPEPLSPLAAKWKAFKNLFAAPATPGRRVPVLRMAE